MVKKIDGRTKKARKTKWIKEQREWGKKFNISKDLTETNIRMRLKGYENIAGLDKRGVNAMKYKNSPKIKVIKRKKKNYYTIWRKKK